MARSEYIYILQCRDGSIMCACTVKRELIAYIHHRCGWGRALLEKECHFIRFSDGGVKQHIYDWSEIPEKPR
jgi:hypothetical protein